MKTSSVRPLRILGLPVLAFAVAGVLLACGGGSGSGSTPAAGGGGSAAAAPAASAPAADAIDFATCGGFDAAAAAALFGAPAAEYEAKRSDESWGTDCSFVRADDFLGEQSVRFTLSRDESAAEAAREMAQLAGNAGIADTATGARGTSHRVADLGDEALWVAANSSLYVRAGAVTVIVTTPNDEARQIEIARALLGG